MSKMPIHTLIFLCISGACIVTITRCAKACVKLRPQDLTRKMRSKYLIAETIKKL